MSRSDVIRVIERAASDRSLAIRLAGLTSELAEGLIDQDVFARCWRTVIESALEEIQAEESARGPGPEAA